MADMTQTTMATYLPEVWSTLATITYRATSILTNKKLIDRRWEPEIGVGRGDTVNVPQFTQNSRSVVNKRSTFGTGASLTWNAVTESQTQIAINQMAYYAFRMPVEMSAQKMAQYEQLLNDAAGPSIAQQVDYEIASDNTNGYDAFTAIGVDNVDVTEDIFLAGETVLNVSNAPVDGRFMVYSAETRASLLQIESFRNQLYQSSMGNLNADKGPGYQGRISTIDCYMFNDLEAGTAGHKNFMGQTEAIAYAEQVGVKVVKDLNVEDGLFNQYVAYNVYGFKQIKSTFGREIDGK